MLTDELKYQNEDALGDYLSYLRSDFPEELKKISFGYHEATELAASSPLGAKINLKFGLEHISCKRN